MNQKEWDSYSTRINITMRRMPNVFQNSLRPIYENMEKSWFAYVGQISLNEKKPSTANQLKMQSLKEKFDTNRTVFDLHLMRAKLMNIDQPKKKF